MRRASNFFKSYHLYENRLPKKDAKELAKKTLHHMKLKEFSEIEADAFEIPFKPSGSFGLNVGKPKTSPNANWSVHEFICENGWAKSQGDPVCYISGRMISTFLSEEPFALVFMGKKGLKNERNTSGFRVKFRTISASAEKRKRRTKREIRDFVRFRSCSESCDREKMENNSAAN
jgi:hypothetical protein